MTDHEDEAAEAAEAAELREWQRHGFGRGDARRWRRWSFGIDEAYEWIRVGVLSGVEAAQWATAGVDPATVKDWLQAEIPSTEAVQWHEFDIGLEQARAMRARGETPNHVLELPDEPAPRREEDPEVSAALRRFVHAGVPYGKLLNAYVVRRWWTERAVEWARAGVPAEDAELWETLRLTPVEGGELTRAGVAPKDVVESFWRRSIPFDEVADWVGAGMRADEAAEAREDGVPVEQAAAMRALRRGGI